MAQPTVKPNSQTGAASRPQLPAFLTTREVASLLRCTETTVRRQARAGTLPGVRYGKEWRFPTGAILRAYNPLTALHGH